MSSATKALDLLTHFSTSRPEIGLSQFCRLAQRDKATTYRHLQALEDTGFVEQNPVTKHYRLGPVLVQLAQTREATVPRKSGAVAALAALAGATGETAHVSVLSGTSLYTLDAQYAPNHSTRAIIDLATLPLHATASGLCALAFGPETLGDTARANLTPFTARTVTSVEKLDAAIGAARASGFGRADRSMEAEVHGIAAPLFDHASQLAGTVSVASVATRMTPDLEQIILANLATASRQITHNWGGRIPEKVEAAWKNTLSNSTELERIP